MFTTRPLLTLAISVGLLNASEAVAQPSSPAQQAQAPQQQAPQQQSQRSAAPQIQKKPAAAPGSLSGKITTVDGTALPAATVTAVKIGSPHKRFETHTNSDGQFSFQNLEPGEWRISVSAEGMLATQEKTSITSGQKTDLNFELEDVEASDVVRVTSSRSLAHADRTTTDTQLGKRFLQEFGSGNNLRQDIQTAPGVVEDSVGNIITRGEHNAVNYELDGVVLPEAAGALNQAQFASPRSLQSIDVQVGGYEAKDGGGPLGAVVRMKSQPIPEKPTAVFGTQLGGPIQGGINYYLGGALSQNHNSLLNKIRIESSGTVYGTSLGIEAPVRRFARNGRANLNFLSKVEFTPTEKDRLRLTVGMNESFLGWPTSKISRQAGVRINEHDREDYAILGYRRLGEKYFDEANLSIVNAFYSQRLTSRNVFDPAPILVGEEPFIASTAATATRFNYIMSAQGDVRKRIGTHQFTAGFLSEIRPVRTRFSAFYYNADPALGIQSQQAQQAAQQAAIEETLATPASEEETTAANEAATAAQESAVAQAEEAGLAPEEIEAAGQSAFDASLAESESVRQSQLQVSAQAAAQTAAAENIVTPYGAMISPFTRTSVGPPFLGDTGNYKGFRYLQSAYIQDRWQPQNKFLRRLTIDAGVRVDVYHGVFGNTLPVANLMARSPGVQPFSLAPFQTQRVTDAQVSGRFGGAFALTKRTVLRGTFSQLFQPPPVDLFSTPPNLAEDPVNGIYPGTLRPLRATRGYVVDATVEQQIGPRFVARNTLFYKKLKNFGDSGVVQNTPLYNRLSLSNQEAYGIENRLELKPNRDGYGVHGFVSSTVAIANLRGLKSITGGIYEFEDEPVTTNYPDHDRRLQLVAGLGYRMKRGFWMLSDVQVLTGLKNGLDPLLFGPQPARTPPLTLVGLNLGYDMPKSDRPKPRALPSGFDVRIENMLNQRKPLNLGSPYQGTRFQLPLRVIAGMYWKV